MKVTRSQLEESLKTTLFGAEVANAIKKALPELHGRAAQQSQEVTKTVVHAGVDASMDVDHDEGSKSAATVLTGEVAGLGPGQEPQEHATPGGLPQAGVRPQTGTLTSSRFAPCSEAPTSHSAGLTLEIPAPQQDTPALLQTLMVNKEQSSIRLEQMASALRAGTGEGAIVPRDITRYISYIAAAHPELEIMRLVRMEADVAGT